jgi:molybdenum cofactor cytidylyltransferase
MQGLAMTASNGSGPVPAVILAAGRSRRLGTAKQLLVWEGETLLRRIARVALAGGGPVWVVTGHRAEAMAEALAGLPVQILVNPEWEEGQAASVRCGVTALPPGVTGVLLLVCDQPAVDPALLERLRAIHRDRPEALVACAYGGARGIPALFPARLLPRLLELRGDRGGRDLLRDPAALLVPFPAGEFDLDRPEDLQPGVS